VRQVRHRLADTILRRSAEPTVTTSRLARTYCCTLPPLYFGSECISSA
jgi:hypothetical protein